MKISKPTPEQEARTEKIGREIEAVFPIVEARKDSEDGWQNSQIIEQVETLWETTAPGHRRTLARLIYSAIAHQKDVLNQKQIKAQIMPLIEKIIARGDENGLHGPCTEVDCPVHGFGKGSKEKEKWN